MALHARLKSSLLRRVALAASSVAASGAALAQTGAPTQLAPVEVRSSAQPAVGVAGWGATPLAELPLQASVIGNEQMRDLGARRLADLISVDPSIGDAYNTEGYWDSLTVRGFVLDNRYNFRRDGLPISAETSIPLDNKSRVEILEGLSGIQAGTSAPGGLVNYVVKRPLDTPLRSLSIDWRQAASVGAALDLSQRFGTGQAFGLRLNAAASRLAPQLRSARGDSNLVALAADWRLSSDTLLEAEVEHSRRSQPSAPGFSLLGNTVPAPVDPRINLNNQPWSLPVVLEGNSASLRWQQRLSSDWRLSAHLATQQLRSDDRVAFPFGSDCNETSSFQGEFYCDRFHPSGSFDLYDFRSENERRRIHAFDLTLQGRVVTGAATHTLAVGVLQSRLRQRFQRQAFNYAGSGNIDASAVVAAAPDLTDENTDRDERSTEIHLQDAVRIGQRFTAWIGLRHTRLERQSVRTDGSRATRYRQSFTSPWLAASYAFAPGQLVYASWGKGIESEVTPNRARYVNPGEALPALASRQTEIGVKWATPELDWGVAWFDIQRPVFADLCDVPASCIRQADGSAQHRGIEASAAWRPGRWELRAGAQRLDARRSDSQTLALNGLRPTNVPAHMLRLQAQYSPESVAGLALQARFSHEASRMVLPDNSARIDGLSQVAVAARYDTTYGATRVAWRVGIDNLHNRRAWKESPYQFGHAYLFPLPPRTLRVALQIDF